MRFISKYLSLNVEVNFLEESTPSSGSVASGTPESVATSFAWSTFHMFLTLSTLLGTIDFQAI